MRLAHWLLALGCASCIPMHAVQSAETAGRGNFELAVEGGMTGAVGPADVDGGGGLSVGARYGLGERVDLGARLGLRVITSFDFLSMEIDTGGPVLETQLKLALRDPGPGGVRVSIAPQLGASPPLRSHHLTPVGYVWFNAPLLVDVPLRENALVVGPRVHSVLVYGGPCGGTNPLILVGSSVGFALDVGPRLTLVPELTLMTSVYGHPANGWVAEGPWGVHPLRGYGAVGLAYVIRAGPVPE